MSLPPFSSKELAKLVLGYLAEEQLMTVYDEFLQESPYLDALRNEYDRIFMRSLRHILTEYRAVKIYVETCKPLALRKQLSECPNLLEVVKVLINNIDLDRIRNFEDGSRNESQTFAEKSSNCEVCNTSKLSSCLCGSKRISQDYSKSQTGSNNAVETTSLEDLPGHNSSNKKKRSRIVTNEVNPPINLDEYNPLLHNISKNRSTLKNQSFNPSVKSADKESVQKTQDFDKILNVTNCNKNASDVNTSSNQMSGTKYVSQSMSTSGTFQDFAFGITGMGSQIINVPDFNSTDNVNVQFANNSLKEGSNRQLYSTVKSNNQSANNMYFPKVTQVSQSKPEVTQNKFDCNKVTILSDVRVDTICSNETSNKSNVQIPPVLNTKQTMPLLQMQTILVNGTPAYKSVRNPEYRYNYTRDEIMAMPTIILVPTTGPSDVSTNKAPHNVMTQSNNLISSGTNMPNSLEPLTIDISDSPDPKLNIETHGASALSMPVLNDGSADKNKEMLNSFANLLPKDTTSLTKTSTPQVIPPVRKSSSTPRRSSHIRVLDFTTPRRILHETIKEHNIEEINEPTIPKVNTSTVPGTSSSMGTKIVDKENDTTQKENATTSNDKERMPINKLKFSDWDATLRAVAVSNECIERKSSSKKTKSESKSKFKKKNKTTEPKKSKDVKKTATPKITGFKTNKRKSAEDDKGSQDTEEKKIDVPIKPTINIISGVEKHPNPNIVQELEKSNNDDPHDSDTLEIDRNLLQSVNGAKLNISDLLDTPYKQALYDIQMETPRFLGPDIGGEPVSDIKIMNIPTPRFLASPNSTATPKLLGSPSQYVSRGTDYSSGSSYYKPEDQDNIPSLDVICASSNANETDKMDSKTTEIQKDSKQIENTMNFKSRPVRQCARNVSYSYNSPFIAKTRKDDKDADVSSESMSISSTKDNYSPKNQKGKRNIKKGTPKHYKKTKQAQTFVKEGNLSRDRRKFTPLDSSKLARKRNIIKEKNVATENVITPAPTKSRRKSSTPRKLNCNKTIPSSPSDRSDPTEKSPEIVKNVASNYDANQSQLRWSDDGSKATPQDHRTGFEGDDIKKIQEYIETTKSDPVIEDGSALQVDLIKRGFDAETARTIERDLLDTPPHPGFNKSLVEETSEAKREDNPVDSGDTNTVNEEEEEYLDDLELSVHECHEGTINYINMEYNETDNSCIKERVTLKEKFSMEVFIEEGLSIRIRATPFNLMFDKDYQDSVEIQQAVDSISHIEPLYTPMKEFDRAQCYEIFDSTLTSLDTPLKPIVQSSRSVHESTITEVVLEVEKIEERAEVREKSDNKKRKRVQSGSASDESLSESKKSRPEAHYLLNSANIQNIDIETVLSKLHGP